MEKLNKALDLLLQQLEGMESAAFIINHRFTVNKFNNEIFDNDTAEKIRLEPRLMKLLCILAENNGKVVKRELIIKEIWDDYPGANEGLNQAISFLRKLLADDQKQIIKTIPKEGYSFNANILLESKGVPVSSSAPVTKKKRNVAMIAAAFLLLLLFFMAGWYYAKRDVPAINQKELGEKDAAEIGLRDSIHQAEQLKKYVQDTLGPAAKGDSIRFRIKQ